jgi:hypothetical protein
MAIKMINGVLTGGIEENVTLQNRPNSNNPLGIQDPIFLTDPTVNGGLFGFTPNRQNDFNSAYQHTQDVLSGGIRPLTQPTVFNSPFDFFKTTKDTQKDLPQISDRHRRDSTVPSPEQQHLMGGIRPLNTGQTGGSGNLWWIVALGGGAAYWYYQRSRKK